MWYLFTLTPQRYVASKQFSFTVTSEPSGAQIFIEGTDIKQLTPYEIKNIKIKNKMTITLKKAGFEEKTITLTSNNLPSDIVSITLVPAK